MSSGGSICSYQPSSDDHGAPAVSLDASASPWQRLKFRVTTCYRGVKEQLPFIYDVALNLRFILSPTPEEYALKAHLHRENKATIVKPCRSPNGRTFYEPYIDMSPAAVGSVRIKLYPNLTSLHRDSVLSIDVPLPPSGELDLRIPQRAWGLQNCHAIDSRRRELFRSAAHRMDVLSPMAVRLLTEGELWLRVIEQPTAGRLAVRSMRRAFQTCGKNVANWFYSLWAKPLSRQLQGYLPATLLLGTCLATTYYMDLSSRLYDFDLDNACDSAWRTFREYTSIVL